MIHVDRTNPKACVQVERLAPVDINMRKMCVLFMYVNTDCKQ